MPRTKSLARKSALDKRKRGGVPKKNSKAAA